MRLHTLLAGVTALVLCSGCSFNSPDYSAYLQHMPKSVLVLPPVNQTADVAASNAFISTVTRPLAECGYYVFPVAVVDRMMKENGVPTPSEMRQIPLPKLGEVFGADAVLYITIKDWSTRYVIVSSSTSVTLEYALVDVRTGTPLWHWQQTVHDNSNNSNSGNITALLVSAAVHAASNVAAGKERDLARKANALAFNHRGAGLIKGDRHPDSKKDVERRSAQK
jgi:hypothetical protein